MPGEFFQNPLRDFLIRKNRYFHTLVSRSSPQKSCHFRVLRTLCRKRIYKPLKNVEKSDENITILCITIPRLPVRRKYEKSVSICEVR